jgi:hypothetical protein
MNRKELRKSVHNLLAGDALTPTFGRMVVLQDLADALTRRFEDSDEEGLRQVYVVRAVQRDTQFVLFVAPLHGEDPDQYAAALEDFIGSADVAVQPYKVPGFPLPDSRGYVEVGGSAEPDTYEVGTGW